MCTSISILCLCGAFAALIVTFWSQQWHVFLANCYSFILTGAEETVWGTRGRFWEASLLLYSLVFWHQCLLTYFTKWSLQKVQASSLHAFAFKSVFCSMKSRIWKNAVLFDKVIYFIIRVGNTIPAVGFHCRCDPWANYCFHLHFF